MAKSRRLAVPVAVPKMAPGAAVMLPVRRFLNPPLRVT